MDQPELDAEEHRRALNGLSRINRLSGSAAILWPSIRRLARTQSRPLRILDIATGAGDLPLRLMQKAKRSGLPISIDGCDISPVAIAHAQERAAAGHADVRYFTLDLFRDPFPAGYDIVTCSLFLHHLDENEAIELLRKAYAATGKLVLVNDLIRSRTGYALAYWGTRLLSRSPIVHFDGPLSVQGAFSMSEALALAVQAGWKKSEIHWRWPYRFLLSGDKT